MKKGLLFFVFGICNCIVGAGPLGLSQTESYLNALAPTRPQAYAKITKVLSNPPPSQPAVRINPEEYEPWINEAIETEKQNPGFYAVYHGTQKNSLPFVLLYTYLEQLEHGWARDDFFILRPLEFFYKPEAKTAADYIKQHSHLIFQQFYNCVERYPGDTCHAFDLDFPMRGQLLSASPAFVAGIDDTRPLLREIAEEGPPSGESTFYYFATGLSWTSYNALYAIMIKNLEKYNPALFNADPLNVLTKKYVELRFRHIEDLLHSQSLTKPSEKNVQAKAGIVFQILIPKNIIDDVVYLAWQNGPLWQRKINGIEAGWDTTLGTYTKISPILDIMQKNPQKLGRSLHLLQVRLIFKDEKYLFNGSSPIKMRIITMMSPSVMQSIEDDVRAVARVIFENKKANKEGNLAQWAKKIDLENEVKRLEKN